MCKRDKPCPPCPPCDRCPEDPYKCKKVPNYNKIPEEDVPGLLKASMNQGNYVPILTDQSKLL